MISMEGSLRLPCGREARLTFRGSERLRMSLSLSRVSKSTYSEPASISSDSFVRLWYRTLMPNTRALSAIARPMPPIPKIPSILPWGSCPSLGRGFPRQLPALKLAMETGRLRRLPRIRKMARSAVEASTAVGVLETRILRAVQASISS